MEHTESACQCDSNNIGRRESDKEQADIFFNNKILHYAKFNGA